MFSVDSPPLTPDGPHARRWLREELAKKEYQAHKPLSQRIIEWLEEHLGDVSVGGVSIPWQLVAAMLLLLVVGTGVFAARRFTRTQRSLKPEEPTSPAVFGGGPRAEARTYRADAERLLASDPTAALVAAYRAVVARSDEAGFLAVSASTTVGDVDATLSAELPEQRQAVNAAGSTFAAVRYGAASASADDVRGVLHLDDVLLQKADAPRTAPAHAVGAGGREGEDVR